MKLSSAQVPSGDRLHLLPVRNLQQRPAVLICSIRLAWGKTVVLPIELFHNGSGRVLTQLPSTVAMTVAATPPLASVAPPSVRFTFSTRVRQAQRDERGGSPTRHDRDMREFKVLSQDRPSPMALSMIASSKASIGKEWHHGEGTERTGQCEVISARSPHWPAKTHILHPGRCRPPQVRDSRGRYPQQCRHHQEA